MFRTNGSSLKFVYFCVGRGMGMHITADKWRLEGATLFFMSVNGGPLTIHEHIFARPLKSKRLRLLERGLVSAALCMVLR